MRGGGLWWANAGLSWSTCLAAPSVSPLDGSGGMSINFYGPVYGVDDFDEAVNKARLRFRRAGN